MLSSVPTLSAAVQFSRIHYHGWNDCLRLRNARAEVIIVPAIGRVMQFRRRDGPEVFWENPQVAGRAGNPAAAEWTNFGGDKSWPAPQSRWPEITGRAWPPPAGFDATPATWERRGDAVDLLSAIDPHYGIRVRRTIRLDPRLARLTVRTTFENVTGEARELAVWVITQLRSPDLVALTAPGGFRELGDASSATQTWGQWISLRRDPHRSAKIGALSANLLWIGATDVLRIHAALQPGARYPDGDSSVEVYTSPDPTPYVELEVLGPLATLRSGGTLTQVSTYGLSRRRLLDPHHEAERLLVPPVAHHGGG